MVAAQLLRLILQHICLDPDYNSFSIPILLNCFNFDWL